MYKTLQIVNLQGFAVIQHTLAERGGFEPPVQ